MFDDKMNFDDDVKDSGFLVLCDRSTYYVSLREFAKNFCELAIIKVEQFYCGTCMDLRFLSVNNFSPDYTLF